MDKLPAAVYPQIRISTNPSPNKFYAIPLVGFVAKILILIPVFIVLLFYFIYASILTIIINPFIVLFSGKYWRMAYEINISFSKYALKTQYFFYGITDKYPGFSTKIKDNFSLDIAYPEAPNRFFAFPVLGFLARIILLIPFYIYTTIISQAASIGILFGAWASVLFKGKYPDSMTELGRDSMRLNFATSFYFLGLSDKYPKFWVSMNHKNIKVFLIVLSILFSLFRLVISANSGYSNPPQQQINTSSTVDNLDLGSR